MIITNNEEALRVKCANVLPNEVGELITLLENELENSNRLGRAGIGLAAPQIGIAKNIAIVRIQKDGVHDLEVNLVNSKIEKSYDQSIFRSEGCLSFPGRVEDTMRYQEVYITNNFVYPYKFIATGLMAIVCQHELDHLNGILLPDLAIIKQAAHKVGPNEPCVCSSGKKYKKCCGK